MFSSEENSYRITTVKVFPRSNLKISLTFPIIIGKVQASAFQLIIGRELVGYNLLRFDNSIFINQVLGKLM